ncbi:MAG: hypothetical protein WA821_20530 [Anaerolineales bacterium]
MNFLAGCRTPFEGANGITVVSSRGIPEAQRIVWSPTDENKILVTVPPNLTNRGSEVYILDTQTGQKNILAKEQPGQLFEAKWTPDGRGTLILSAGSTPGFETAGWWKMDIENKSSEYLMEFGDAAWSPDAKTIALLHQERNSANEIVKVDLQLVDAKTNAVQTIYTTDKVDFTWGISWSPDGQYLVFSLGQGSHGNLYIVNIKTQQTKKVTENDRSDFPVWSPKGNIIAFEVYEEKEYSTVLHLIDPEGKCDVIIPNIKGGKSPTWSPDGKKLGYIDIDNISFLDVNQVIGRDIYQNLCP